MKGIKGSHINYEPPVTEPRRKPGKRVSDSKKRSNHKHIYEDTISVYFSCLNGSVLHIVPTKHCRICGRYGGGDCWFSNYGQYDVTLPDGSSRSMTVPELKERFPGIPIYTNGPEPNHIFPDIRIT